MAVIGGGPAGSTSAALLAQRGFRVEVFEATKFPRPHIGESLLPATIQALELSGAAAKVREAGFTLKRGATMAWGLDHQLWTWNFSETNTKQSHAYQVNRDEFDHILLEHAKVSGATVHEDSAVDRVRFEEHRATGVEIGKEFHAADFIVDASGQQSLVATQQNKKIWDEEFRNLAVYRYYKGGTHLADEAAGNILVESVDEGWLWKIPLKGNISSVGIVADRDRATNAIRKGSVQDWFESVVASSTYTSEFLNEAFAIGEVTATRDWSYSSSSFTGSNHCLIGDAACFIDPLFSTGVHLAIYSATIGAAFVTTALENPDLATLAGEAFERQYREHYSHFRELARLFYGSNQSIDSYFWQARQITGETSYSPRNAFVRAVSGQTSRGYERTTLSHGKLPQSFVNSIQSIEKDREKRLLEIRDYDETKRYCVNPEVKVVDAAVFTGDRFEEGQVIRREGLNDLSVSEFVVGVIKLLQERPCFLPDAQLELIQDGWPNQTVANAFMPTIELLYVEGIIEQTSIS